MKCEFKTALCAFYSLQWDENKIVNTFEIQFSEPGILINVRKILAGSLSFPEAVQNSRSMRSASRQCFSYFGFGLSAGSPDSTLSATNLSEGSQQRLVHFRKHTPLWVHLGTLAFSSTIIPSWCSTEVNNGSTCSKSSASIPTNQTSGSVSNTHVSGRGSTSSLAALGTYLHVWCVVFEILGNRNSSRLYRGEMGSLLEELVFPFRNSLFRSLMACGNHYYLC